ncbi:enoyl-CoA hydratase-related protein [Pseudonocardia halophobica]|uniref:enoyl-CoA hydratase-related protein n=1 Tax=Pseudonocardia halophobica TaxID=29401 RepID=UPI003D8CF015
MPRFEGSEHVLVSRPEPGVAVLELARGKVNAIDHAFYAELGEVFDAVSADEEIRCAVLTGRGHVFCAGNDLRDFAAMDARHGEEHMRTVRRCFSALLECAVPVVAAVNGPALGSGLGLVASCDLVVASERATFGLPEMGVGVLGGGRFTARMLPQQAVRRLFFTAEPVDAATFRDWGAPAEVVAHEELLPAALRLARSVAAKDRHALTLAKQSLNGCEPLDLERGYRLEQTFTVRLSEHASSRDAVAGRMAELGMAGPNTADRGTAGP